jgi:aminoglycoside 6'-N-acetyltransferase I
MRQTLWPDSQPEEVDALLSDGVDSRVWFLVHERASGELGGFVEVGTRSYAEGCLSSPVAYLEGLWVDPDLRRQGVARELVDAAEAWAITEGLTELASDTGLDNLGSQAFHSDCGFEETDRVICFRKCLVGPE